MEFLSEEAMRLIERSEVLIAEGSRLGEEVLNEVARIRFLREACIVPKCRSAWANVVTELDDGVQLGKGTTDHDDDQYADRRVEVVA